MISRHFKSNSRAPWLHRFKNTHSRSMATPHTAPEFCASQTHELKLFAPTQYRRKTDVIPKRDFAVFKGEKADCCGCKPKRGARPSHIVYGAPR